MGCPQRVVRRSGFIESEYESHTDQANRRAGSDGTGGLAGSATEVERNRGENPWRRESILLTSITAKAVTRRRCRWFWDRKQRAWFRRSAPTCSAWQLGIAWRTR